jgi:hypothetical protein
MGPYLAEHLNQSMMIAKFKDFKYATFANPTE